MVGFTGNGRPARSVRSGFTFRAATGWPLLLDVRRPGATAVLSERVWCLSGPGCGSGVLYRTVSTSRAGSQGLMLLRGARVTDEGRASENRTIRIIRDLLDLDVLNASDCHAAFPAGQHDGSCA